MDQLFFVTGVAVRSSPDVPLTVGQNATLTCTNDDVALADLIEWRSSDGTVLARDTSVNMLELLLAPVNDSLSIQGVEFTCHVTRNSDMFTQSLPITVIGKFCDLVRILFRSGPKWIFVLLGKNLPSPLLKKTLYNLFLNLHCLLSSYLFEKLPISFVLK